MKLLRSPLRQLPTKLRSHPGLATLLPIAVVLLIVASIVLIQRATTQETGPSSRDSETYIEQLRNQVDEETGAPRDGRDPSTQQQTSLNAAASQPSGIRQSDDKPTTSVSGEPSQTGIGPNGCYVDYGIQGEQCLPAHVATNGTPTCDGVRQPQHFPNGIVVSGTDRFHLDTNHDGTACGAGD